MLVVHVDASVWLYPLRVRAITSKADPFLKGRLYRSGLFAPSSAREQRVGANGATAQEE